MKFTAALALSCAAMAMFIAAAQAQPAIKVNPTFNPPSTSTSVSGSGFGANEIVDLYFDTTDEALAVTNASGAFSKVAIGVPASALPGVHWITAGGRHSGLGAQTSFIVRTDWAQQGYGSQNKAFNPFENVLSPSNVAGLDQVWSMKGILGPPTEYEGKLFVATRPGSSAVILALNPASGAPIWHQTTSDINGGRLTEAAGLVFFAQDGVVALKAANGAIGWNTTEPQTIVGPVTAADGAIYASGNSGTLFVLDGKTGAPLWTGTAEVNNSFGQPTVAQELGQENVYAPCGTDVCALNQNGDVWDDAALSSGTTPTSSVVSNGRVFFGDAQGNFAALDANTASGVVDSDLGAFVAAPAAADDVVYAASHSSLYARDPQFLAAIWSVAGIFSSQPAVANGVVYVGDANGSLYAFAAASGARLWTADVSLFSGAPVTANIVTNGMLFATASNGILVAYALNAGNNSVYHRNAGPPAVASLHPDLSLSPWHHAKFRSADEQ